MEKKRANIDSITASEPPNTNDNIESTPQEKDIYYEPNYREDADRNNDSYNNFSTQQNIYYEPPNIENSDTINNSNNNIPQQQNIYYKPPNRAVDNYY